MSLGEGSPTQLGGGAGSQQGMQQTLSGWLQKGEQGRGCDGGVEQSASAPITSADEESPASQAW